MNPNAPSVPSPVEAACYYYGLPSEPALVARSSVNPWVEPRGPEAYLVAKELLPVGPHDLDRVWESTVASAIETYLENQQVKWTSLDPVRIGFVGDKSFPVIIWVGVVPGSLAAEKGLEVALGCRAILTENGISDVHVEIRQSDATLHAKLSKPVPTSDPTAQVIEPFSTTLGLSICRADTTNFEGTDGFFFIDSKHPGKLYLVTARHVLFHPDRTKNDSYTARFNSQVAIKVLLLGDDALQKRVEAIQSEIDGKKIVLKQLAARKNLLVEGQDDKSAQREREDVLREEDKVNEAGVVLKELLRDVTRDWCPPADRTIGHIILSPPLGFSIGLGQHTDDWAVIKIDHSRVNKANFVANCIDLGTSIPVDKFTSCMYPHPANPHSFDYPGDRLLRFFGTIPDSQMGGPNDKTLDHNNDPAIMVIKRGGASGLTVGRLNTIRSVIRYYFKGGPGQRTREVAVYPRNSKSGPFSKEGDSGSVVIDGKGKVVGILTGGAGTKSSDCTYITSINFLIKRLQENGYEPNIFPTAADI